MIVYWASRATQECGHRACCDQRKCRTTVSVHDLSLVNVRSAHICLSLNDHSVFSIMAWAEPNSSTTEMSSSPQNLRAAQELFYQNLTGPYTAPSGITNGFQRLNEQQLRVIGAQAVIDAGLANQNHIEYLFETVW